MNINGVVVIVDKNEPIPSFSQGTTVLKKTTLFLLNRGCDYFMHVLPDGHVFKVIGNVRKYDKRDIDKGFLRIGFSWPEQDMLVWCERTQLIGMMPKKIDEKVLSLAFLRELNISNNRLVEIPEELGSVPTLNVLLLANNCLGRATNWKWLNSPIIRQNLKLLDLCGNSLKYVPEAIMHLRNLQSLNLSANSLEELPMSIRNLVKLHFLFLAHNNLKFLPGTIKRLPELNSLDMKDNMFSHGWRVYNAGDPVLTEEDFKLKSLFHTAARVTVRKRCPYWFCNIPVKLAHYLQYRVKYCHCGSPMFDDNARIFHLLLRTQKLADDTPCDFIVHQRIPVTVYICSYKCYKYYKRSKVVVGEHGGIR